jgi:hypothetical protein
MDSTSSGASGSSRMPASLFGAAFEAATELAAGLVAHLDDLEDGHGPIEMDPAAAQAGQLTEPQAGAQEDEHVIPPGQGYAAEQSTGWSIGRRRRSGTRSGARVVRRSRGSL